MKNARIKFFRLCSAIAIIVLLSISSYGQSDVGSISGFIKDQSGAVVPNAKVTISNEGTDEVHTVFTDAQGHYTVTNLPPASYTMIAEAAGFKKLTSTHNVLAASTALALDGNLSLGAVTQDVEVNDTAVVLQTESGSVQSEIPGKTITDQQLNGRNPLFMGSLLPGLRSSTTLGDFNFAIGSSVPFNVNGARQQDTLVTFDGAPAVRTRGSGRLLALPIPMPLKKCRFSPRTTRPNMATRPAARCASSPSPEPRIFTGRDMSICATPR